MTRSYDRFTVYPMTVEVWCLPTVDEIVQHSSPVGTKRKCFRPITVMPGIEDTADVDVRRPERGEEDRPCRVAQGNCTPRRSQNRA
jgi:hypothetical protein